MLLKRSERLGKYKAIIDGFLFQIIQKDGLGDNGGQPGDKIEIE